MKSLIILTSIFCTLQLISADGNSIAGSNSYLSGKIHKLAFGVARSGNISPPGLNRLQLPENVSNVDGWYNHDTDDFTAPSDGLYFLYICVGVRAHARVLVQQTGGYPQIMYTWQSTNQNDVLFGCRAGISRLPWGVSVRLNTQGGGIFSNKLQQTSFSVFSITDAMTSAKDALFATFTSNSPYITRGPIPFGRQTGPNIIYVNPTLSKDMYNSADYTYSCMNGGYYLVSMSVGVNSSAPLRVQLTGSRLTTFELTRTSRTLNGLVVLSRSVLLKCSIGSGFQVKLVDGEITSGPSTTGSLISLTVIRYAPMGQTTAWAVYLDTTWSASNTANQVIQFNVVEISDSVTYNNGLVTVSYTGIYLVDVSAATNLGQPMNVTVWRNNDAVMGLGVPVTATDGVEMMEHGVIMQLTKGDVLKVTALSGTSTYSDSGLQAGFWGVLLYEV